jgi:hypothetical protein
MRYAVLALITISLLLVGSAPSSAAAPNETPNTLTDQEAADGWILLFDGETLFGWEPNSDANWAVKDGAITVSSGEKGLLCTTSRFADYEFSAEFQAASGTNSGVFLRTPRKPADPTKDCYELNIAPPDNPFPTGSLVGRAKYAGAEPSEGWHRFDVTCRGAQVIVKLDGKQVLEYTDPEPLKIGHIGLQLNSGAVSFRNVKLKPLSLKSIFNGRDLTGWKASGVSRWTVNDQGELNVKDGRGSLESEGTWGDFVLQCQVYSNGKGLNSGIFFRNIPGSDTQGYESQIHNGYKEDDRTQPADFGTGGIYRRVPARKVVADDFTWFTKTLLVDGPHVAVWVNGIQVTDWTDTRKPDENPRRGLRTEAGTLVLQGHDPTTDLNFRNFRITELPE